MDYDVVACGGGPAGMGAAFSAAELGLKTAIIERHSILGGNWTNGYVLSILGVYTYSGKTKIVGGIVDKIVERLKAIGGTNGKVGNFIPFRPDEMKIVASAMAKELGIDVYINSLVVSAESESGAIKSINITGKNGTFSMHGKVFIDSSGDADLAYTATRKAFIGKSENGEHQQATIPFRIENVDEQKVIDYAKGHSNEVSTVLDESGNLSRIRIQPKLVEKAKSEGILYLPFGSSEFLFNTSKRGEFVCNATHVNVDDFTNGNELSKAMEDARKQIISSLKFIIGNIPGFKDAYLIDSAPYIGLRETRRGVGNYVLSKNDVLGNARFDDAIIRCGHPLEIHDKEKGVYYVHLNGGDDSWYEIPYRSITVNGISNLFIIGRCLSAEFEAQASARVTGTALGMGQAAATAAYIMIKNSTASTNVNIKDLQMMLKENGAIL